MPSAADAANATFPDRLSLLPTTRVITDGVLEQTFCQELIFIHRAVGTVGYRPGVRSTTIHDIIAACPALLPPLVRARQAVWQAVERELGLQMELCVEFTGLISWTPGASLGWHHDANRPYLVQRHVSAVLYLNDQGGAFGGGDLMFQGGQPKSVAPAAGRLVAYTADERNTHAVSEVAWGERVTLTMWFSLEGGASEDAKALQTLTLQGGAAALAARCCRCSLQQPMAPDSACTEPASSCLPRADSQGQQQQGCGVRKEEAGTCPEAGSSSSSSDGGGCSCSRRGHLGFGLPDTMYQLPGAPAGGDLRLQWLLQLGLGLRSAGTAAGSVAAATADDPCTGQGHARSPVGTQQDPDSAWEQSERQPPPPQQQQQVLAAPLVLVRARDQLRGSELQAVEAVQRECDTACCVDGPATAAVAVEGSSSPRCDGQGQVHAGVATGDGSDGVQCPSKRPRLAGWPAAHDPPGPAPCVDTAVCTATAAGIAAAVAGINPEETYARQLRNPAQPAVPKATPAAASCQAHAAHHHARGSAACAAGAQLPGPPFESLAAACSAAHFVAWRLGLADLRSVDDGAWCAALGEWERYCCSMHGRLVALLPAWLASGQMLLEEGEMQQQLDMGEEAEEEEEEKGSDELF